MVSKAIRFYDEGEFSHVAIAVSDTHIFEAQYYTRARIVKMHYKDYEVVSLSLTDREQAKLRVICGILRGKWYDYVQIFGYLLRHYFGLDVGKLNNPNNLICSEALALILYTLDKTDELWDIVTPNELYFLLKGVSNNTLQTK